MSSPRCLAALSRYFGEGLLWVQASGGNISIKTGNDILIKPSGMRLRQITQKSGYLRLPIKRSKDNQFIFATKNCAVSRKPSIESGMHLLMPHPVVIHTHPIALNALLCSSLPDDAIFSIFNRSGICPVIVSYARPGVSLARRILKELPKAKGPADQSFKVLFLRNHGLVIAARDKKEAIKISRRIHNVLKRFFPRLPGKISGRGIRLRYLGDKLFKARLAASFGLKGLRRSDIERALSPDMAVFCGKGRLDMSGNEILIRAQSQREARFAAEVLAAQLKALSLMKAAGIRPKYLNHKEISGILSMREEKYRQDLLKN